MLSMIMFAAVLQSSTTPAPRDEGTTQPAVRTRTAAEIQATRTDSEGLVEVTLRNGVKTIDLQGRFQMESAMVKDADGQWVYTCGNQADAAKHGHAHAKVAPSVSPVEVK
jgi:hypothetical protein